MEIVVQAPDRLTFQGRAHLCVIGRGGIRARKREGDGVTPAGVFCLRRLLYRADRLEIPQTGLAVAALSPGDGWCDDAGHADYNRQVTLPHPASCEELWRDDGIYDLVVVLGHNDAPVVAGAGSAIFLHLARPDFSPTAGCVALARSDLLEILEACDPATRIRIEAA